jgi:hypothetical protein
MYDVQVQVQAPGAGAGPANTGYWRSVRNSELGIGSRFFVVGPVSASGGLAVAAVAGGEGVDPCFAGEVLTGCWLLTAGCWQLAADCVLVLVCCWALDERLLRRVGVRIF